MAWIIGIDEAGYGPNLGPLVMTAVACRVPREWVGADLWHALKSAVRRDSDPSDERILIADSKVVYASGRGLAGLERGVLALVPSYCQSPTATLGHLLNALTGADPTWAAHPWHHGRTILPHALAPEELTAAVGQLRRACADDSFGWCPLHSVLFCPPAFNDLVDRWQTKGAVLAEGLARLLQRCRAAAPPDEELHFFIDKHGGRNTYAAMLQHAIPDGFVAAQHESNLRSTYIVHGTTQRLHFTFQPRADGEHLCVAYASMVSKYIRELSMGEFNDFWQREVPGLKPTAGYPVDAVRYFAAIRPAMERLGIGESIVWRKK